MVIQPKKSIKATLEEVGYPFKSKEHSQRVHEYQRNHKIGSYIQTYIYKDGKFGCPKMLRYQFTEDFKLKVSHLCCREMKKNPSKKWAEENGKSINITGMMRQEGGQRTHIECINIKNGKATKFHPLAKVDSDWEEWFIEEYKIPLCKLYYPPYNFKRTGCKGCPFSLDLAEQLAIMDRYGMENERRQCEIVWKPVYDEYRRIGYRLEDEEQTILF